MNLELPPDAESFVRSLVREGRFAAEEEAVAEGLRLLISRERLRQEIQVGVDQVDAGQGLDEEAVYDEVEAVIRDMEARRAGNS